MTASTTLKFITAGSVDDGKSTLIGRLLYDSKAVLADHISALSKSRAQRTAGGELDLSLLTDGLEAEREQGITIDVAYRYFTTPARKFIVADAPGHVQYTRNMVTGASNSDVVLVLVDVTKLDFTASKLELLLQTKRHSVLAGLLGLQRIVLVVNKMDAIGFDQSAYERVVSAFTELAADAKLSQFDAVPLSALHGDNVVHASSKTPWYTGPTLLALLESIELKPTSNETAKLAVQSVVRKDGERYLLGRLSSGNLNVGDTLYVLPSGQSAQIKALGNARGAADEVHAGQSISAVLDTQLDISRGNWLVGAPQATTRKLKARVAWLDAEPLSPSRKYWLRHGTHWSLARVSAPARKLDLADLQWKAADGLAANEIAELEIDTQDALAISPFAESKAAGSFILVDASSNHTVAAGLAQA
jgi:sulfate adenylyltransferase subunit 1